MRFASPRQIADFPWFYSVSLVKHQYSIFSQVTIVYLLPIPFYFNHSGNTCSGFVSQKGFPLTAAVAFR